MRLLEQFDSFLRGRDAYCIECTSAGTGSLVHLAHGRDELFAGKPDLLHGFPATLQVILKFHLVREFLGSSLTRQPESVVPRIESKKNKTFL